MSSWLPRVPSLGRFSPFGGTPRGDPSSPAPRITEDDFSYITSEDIQQSEGHLPKDDRRSSGEHHHHHHHHHSGHANTYDHRPRDVDRGREADPRHSEPNILHKTPSYPQPASTSSGHLAAPGSHRDGRSRSRQRSQEPSKHREHLNRPARDTDVIHFRHKGNTLPVHFAAYGIDDGIVTVFLAREQAARRLDVHDPRRIRMFWDGRNLKDDSMTLRDAGLRSSEKSEVTLVTGNEDRGDSASESGDEEEDGSMVDGDRSASGSGRRKKRRRGGKKKTKKTASPAPASPAYSGPAGGGSEHLPIPSGLHPLSKSTSTSGAGGASAKSSRQPSPQPQTPLGKLQQLEDRFHAELQPMAESFIRDPPREKDKRDYEHKKVGETIMTQVLLKLDGVETEGDQSARQKRKDLVKEVQDWLNRVDEVMKK